MKGVIKVVVLKASSIRSPYTSSESVAKISPAINDGIKLETVIEGEKLNSSAVKKYALEKAIHTGLKQLMHKNNFIDRVEVRIEHDIMDIDLFDQQDQPVDKTSLSKGEQQLYATALLKALVDESGIDFPVFIDSPLQKFDPEHSQNIIKEFYPSVSAQVVLFPLLDKELSEQEYELLKPNLKIAPAAPPVATKIKFNNLF